NLRRVASLWPSLADKGWPKGEMRSLSPDQTLGADEERSQFSGRPDMVNQDIETPKARTGVPGLDKILAGGFAPGRVFLVEGTPGTGKTTIALRFLIEGAKAGEQGLYVTLSETANELHAAATSHGWTLDDSKIEVFEVQPPESLLDAGQQQSLLYSSDLELGETTR